VTQSDAAATIYSEVSEKLFDAAGDFMCRSIIDIRYRLLLCRHSSSVFVCARLVATVYSRYKLTPITCSCISGDLLLTKSMSSV